MTRNAGTGLLWLTGWIDYEDRVALDIGIRRTSVPEVRKDMLQPMIVGESNHELDPPAVVVVELFDLDDDSRCGPPRTDPS